MSGDSSGDPDRRRTAYQRTTARWARRRASLAARLPAWRALGERRGQRPQAGQQLQTADRLRGLRIRLAALVMAINVVGLAGMGAVALLVDERQRDEVVAAELRRTASTAAALLYYDSASLRLDKLFDNAVASGPTAVYVYEAGRAGVTLVFAYPARLPVIPPAGLLGPARAVWASGTELTGPVLDGAGTPAPLLAVPFEHAVTGTTAGAVVVVGDSGPAEAANRRLALALVVGGLSFTILACAGGYLLARRGTEPIAEALNQQERFVADAAHELRTPLTVIRAVSDTALAEPQRRPAALRQVVRSADRLADSVSVLLTRAQLVAGLRDLRREPFRLDQLAEEVLADTVVPPHTGEPITEPVVAVGDPALIRIALRNLIQNAVQHGRVADLPAEVCLRVSANPPTVRVRDRGSGLDEAVAAAPGQRFRTSAEDGTGLGLAIASWVAELHGGHLRLSNADGGGTEARLRLPDSPAPAARRT
ncbi:HAMP domain-containing sensor histidine kinase [Solwaraspora sp. WMMD406]|uniref:sensor histidine kinase n=1 Tax=Solwaraspora sp. WMMD406 TaxID=3016095 RepID=UPI002416E66C|nr:HAMP domain-containing sensor histidine kinase [Solwaraspora sp. WMMD406]MDG4763548.1 HAMP domain-containing sensor histidine kinase [Solwaraspora sp. WMMD406]